LRDLRLVLRFLRLLFLRLDLRFLLPPVYDAPPAFGAVPHITASACAVFPLPLDKGTGQAAPERDV
jgi:hypothetical protein